PHRFGNAELLQEVHARHARDLFGIELGRAPDGVEIDRADLLETLQGLFAHAALADDGAHAELAQDVRLIRLLTNAGRRPGGLDVPVAILVLKHDGAAVIEDRTV